MAQNPFHAVLVMALCILVGCTDDVATQADSKAAEMRTACQQRIQEIAESAKSGDAATHSDATLGLLVFMSHSSLSALKGCEDLLLAAAKSNGFMSVASPIIDYDFRLARLNTDLAQSQSELFRSRAIRAWKKYRAGNAYALWLQDRHMGTYRVADSAWATGITGLALSDYGRKTYAAGYTPSELIRTVALLSSCIDLDKRGGEITSSIRGRCKEFTDEAQSQTDSQELPADVLQELSSIPPIAASMADCVAEFEDSGMGDMIQKTEDILSCMDLPGQAPNELLSSAGTTTKHNNGPSAEDQEYISDDEEDEYEYVGSEEYVKITDDETMTQETHTYRKKDGSGDTIEVTHSAVTEADGSTTSGTYVQESTSDSTTYTAYDESGQQTFEANENKTGANSYTEYKDGVPQHTVSADEDGQISKQNYDEDGNPEGEPERIRESCGIEPGDECPPTESNTNSSPAPWDEQCVKDRLNPKNAGIVGTGVGPLIYPDPNSGPVDSPACFITSQNAPTTQHCPPSVVMCLPPATIDLATCQCTNADASSPPALGGHSCQYTQCPPAASCNPNTGACETVTPDGGRFPIPGTPAGPLGPPTL